MHRENQNVSHVQVQYQTEKKLLNQQNHN